jgi:hypothetical protein
MSRNKLSRRDFLVGTGTAGFGAALSAIVPIALSRPSRAQAQANDEIVFLVRTDIRSAYAADVAVEQWNESFPDRQIVIDEPAGDGNPVATKIQAAQAAGDLVWDGFAVIAVPWDTAQWVNRGLIQPLDPFIDASGVANASMVIESIIGTVLASSKNEAGETIAIPGNVGSIALGWYNEPLAAAGIEGNLLTWEDVRSAAEAIAASNPDITPYDVALSPLGDLVAMIWGATDSPLTEDGLIDWQSDASLESIRWLQGMAADGLMPIVHSESFSNWLQRGTGIMSSFDVHGTLAQQQHGEDAATTGINMRKEADNPAAGAPFWLNGCVVLDQSGNPQGMTDFFLWWFGPDNKEMGRQIATVAAKPAYSYTYEEFIQPDPVQAWQQEGIDLVAQSVPFPANLLWNIQTTAVQPYLEQALDPDDSMSAEEAIELALQDIEFEMLDLE